MLSLITPLENDCHLALCSGITLETQSVTAARNFLPNLCLINRYESNQVAKLFPGKGQINLFSAEAVFTCETPFHAWHGDSLLTQNNGCSFLLRRFAFTRVNLAASSLAAPSSADASSCLEFSVLGFASSLLPTGDAGRAQAGPSHVLSITEASHAEASHHFFLLSSGSAFKCHLLPPALVL